MFSQPHHCLQAVCVLDTLVRMLSGYSHQIGPGMYNPVDKQSYVYIELIHCDNKHDHCDIQIEGERCP
jgi:hypothetical protein